jgi:lipid-binding SYLF domain-containing protein
LAAVGVMWLAGCSTAPKSTASRENLDAQVQTAIQTAKNTDPGLQKFFDTAAGYAVFPSVGKGAFVAGGAFGRGQLFQGGQLVGYCSLTQATVGLAVGGQEYTEIIFLETPDAVNKFKAGDLAFAAQASAVAVKSGASANAKYANNVLVFTLGESGLMVEASIGGQKFSYQPLGSVPPTAPSPGRAQTSGEPAVTTASTSSTTTK